MAWVEYTGSFKDAISISRTNNVPFKTVRGPKDEYTWQDSGKLLKLHENTFSSSGALHLRVADGWRVAFRIATENTDYFNDNIKSEYMANDASSNTFIGMNTGGTSTDNEDPVGEHDEVSEVWVYEDKDFWQENQSNVLFTLYGDDYLSVDVDGDHSNIANFSLHKGTVNYDVSTDREMSDDTFIRMIKAWYWVDDLPPTTYEVEEDDGNGDEQSYEGNFNENEGITDEDIKEGDKGEIAPTPKPEEEQKPTIEPDPKPEDDGQEGGDGDSDGDGDGDGEGDGDSEADEENYSIFLVLGGITLILVGAFVFLRRGGSIAE